MKHILYIILFTFPLFVTAQTCASNQKEVKIHFETDQFGFETSWTLVGKSGTKYAEVKNGDYQGSSIYDKKVCVAQNDCLTFELNDSGGDGILIDPGYFWVTLGKDTIVKNKLFLNQLTEQFNCQIGQICATSIPIKTGNFQSLYEETWYSFKPDSLGSYKISTCQTTANCDTKIYGYAQCSDAQQDTTQVGTLFFADFSSNCGQKAEITSIILEKNKNYSIRIGNGAACKNKQIQWSLQYLGKPKGCLDSTACNYNPLAVVSDNSCISFGNPSCGGPDLVIDQVQLSNTIKLDSINVNANDCTLKEGCLNGDGKRYVVRFNTKIWNKGDQDFFIADLGNPKFQDLLTFDPCHQHVHYENYAEYLLFDNKGKEVNKGNKVGFQVRDLLCELNAIPKYNYKVFGISKGCFDEYDNGLPCQWLDITSVPDGEYTLVVRVNWQKAADGLGRIEKDFDNNWGQLCVKISSFQNGRTLKVLPNCPTLQDCTGTPLGNAKFDCNNVCGGKTITGDLNANGTQEISDIADYQALIVDKNTVSTLCNDLNQDKKITVIDAALLQDCIKQGTAHQHSGQGAHNHCSFGAATNIISDTVFYKILSINPSNKVISIGIRNPYCAVHGFQFAIQGTKILSAETPLSAYPMQLKTGLQSGIVTGLLNANYNFPKSNVWQPFLDIYYKDDSNNICIAAKSGETINGEIQKIVSIEDTKCVTTVATEENLETKPQINFFPNPAKDNLEVTFSSITNDNYFLNIYNTNGQIINAVILNNVQNVIFDVSNLESNLYFATLTNARTKQVVAYHKIIVLR